MTGLAALAIACGVAGLTSFAATIAAPSSRIQARGWAPAELLLYRSNLLGSDLTVEEQAAITGGLSSAIAQGAVVTGVPEPTSWAMLIAGFGLVGAVARRRSAAAA